LLPVFLNPDLRVRITDGSGRLLSEMTLPPGHSHGEGFSRDGSTLALVWHAETEAMMLIVWDAVTGREVRRLSPPRGQDLGGMALSPDGSRVAALLWPLRGSDAPSLATLTIWETATGREVLSRRLGYANPAVYSPDGRWIVLSGSASATDEPADDQVVWLDARTGEQAAALKVRKGHLARWDRVAFSHDGRRLATYAAAGPSSVLVWDVEPILRGESPEPAATLTGQGGEVTHVEFSPDGRRVLTAGGGVVKLWDVVSGREVLTLKASAAAISAAYFSPDGHTIWGGLDEAGRLWGWDGTPLPEGKTP
jgi:WD40 repeat protein